MRNRRSPSRRCDPQRARAFTVLELLVVIVLLAVIASLVAPRLTDTAGRRVQAAAERVADAVSAVARRDAMMSQPLAITYDASTNSLRSQALVRSARTGAASWVADPLLPDAELADAQLVSVEVDGASLDPRQLRIEFDQFQPRPSLRLVLADERGGNLTSIDMPASSVVAQVVGGDIRQSPGAARAVDLDDEGKERVAW